MDGLTCSGAPAEIVSDAEAAVAAAMTSGGHAALKTCLDQIRSQRDAASRSSITYNVWREWIQSMAPEQ